MQKPLRWYDSLTINIYFFGLTLRAQTLTPLILPLLVQQFVGDVLVHLKCYRNRIVGSKENVTEVNGERNRPNEYR